VVYKKGTLNTNADALSRVEINPTAIIDDLDAASMIGNADDDLDQLIRDAIDHHEVPDSIVTDASNTQDQFRQEMDKLLDVPDNTELMSIMRALDKDLPQHRTLQHRR